MNTSGKKCEHPLTIPHTADCDPFALQNPLSPLRRSLDRLGLLGLLLGGRSGSGLLLGLLLLGDDTLGALGTVGRGPEGEVVAQELHDEGAVAVALLGERVKLGNGVVKGLLGEVACAVGRVEDLVVEDGEVQGETKADRVGRGKVGLGNIRGVLDSGVNCCQEGGMHDKSSRRNTL